MTPALNDAEINERLARLNGWERVGDTIQKTGAPTATWPASRWRLPSASSARDSTITRS